MDERVAVELTEVGDDPGFGFGLDATRMWRSMERAILGKNPSTRLSQEPCLGVNTNEKRPSGWASTHALVSFEICAEWLSRISLMAI